MRSDCWRECWCLVGEEGECDVDPNKRITVKEALESEFLRSIRKPEMEIVTHTRMLFPFEYDSMNDEGEKLRLRRLIYQEATQFQ